MREKKTGRYEKIIVYSVLLVFLMTIIGCGKQPTYDVEPLMGMTWNMSRKQIEDNINDIEFKEERTTDEYVILDYTGAEFDGIAVDVSFVLKDDKLIGIDYHDLSHSIGFVKWTKMLEDKYGAPNENAADSASWFDNPVGENTVVYLFDRAEGVQISFYGTADTPDKTYDTRISEE